jgi:hypothetical protein
MPNENKQDWIDDVEFEDANIKWAWSHFDGRDPFNGDGHYSFTLILPEETAREMIEAGWTGVKRNDGYEEGDPDEYTLKCKISYKFEAPKIFLIKNGRKFRADERDLHDITRDMTDQIDVILTPSRWVQGSRTGVTAYVKEMYAKVRESRFGAKYADYEEM